jgi:glycosyltransferase involved in cell wall biosynthesis
VRVDAVIPALDEEATIGAVVRSLPRRIVRTIVVVDNGSRDATAEQARAAGAQVVCEPRRGYGAACLAGIAALPPDGEVIVFLDADGSDDVTALERLLEPIEGGRADLVVGSRAGRAAEGLTGPQRAGNAVAAAWLRRRYGMAATDLGPFRAIRRQALDALEMADRDYGWTVEMQIKAARLGLAYEEIHVRALPRRGGRSKVSGTVAGVIGAAWKILALLVRNDLFAVKRTRSRRRRAGPALPPDR